MTTLAIILAVGLLAGLVLARIAARGRRIRLTHELRHVEAELERLGYIAAALQAYPFGDGIPSVVNARNACRFMQDVAHIRRAGCQAILAGSAKVRP